MKVVTINTSHEKSWLGLVDKFRKAMVPPKSRSQFFDDAGIAFMLHFLRKPGPCGVIARKLACRTIAPLAKADRKAVNQK